jgi:alginate O-acetyltransferase complex protein AlgI
VEFLSAKFAALLTGAVVLFHLLPLKARRPYLLALSYLFYATWSVVYLGLLLSTTSVAYFVGRQIERTQRAGLWVGLSVPALLLPLAGFKYLPATATQLGIHGPFASLLAPLGISYYTFRLISYVLDVWQGKVRAEPSWVAFALYVAFFPQIVSGPIQRAGDFLAQMEPARPADPVRVRGGLRLLLFGLFEKLVVADRLAPVVNNVFDNLHASTGLALAVAAYAYAFQLYADFSGLTDIAIGIGRLFGIEGPRNFDNPFYSPNIQQFWRRWHITLTSWLTDYLFTPLNFALRRLGRLGLMIAIFVTMLAVGLWHGARATAVTFGLINGVYMAVSAATLRGRNRFFKARPRLSGIRGIVGPLVTFHLVVLALAVFRSQTLSDAAFFLQHLIPISRSPAMGLRGLGLIDQLGYIGITFIPVMEAVHLARGTGALGRALTWSPTWLRWSFYYAAVLVVAVLGQSEVTKFIYAQF